MPLERFKTITADAIASGVIIVVAILFYLVVKRGIAVLERERHVDSSMALRLKRVVRWVLVGSVVLMVVQQTGVFRNAWAVLSAALATIAIGFVALWSVLSNVVCAVMILAYKPFRQGDLIELLEPSGPSAQAGETFRGLTGVVKDINLMFTTLQEPGDSEQALGFELRVPNNVFFQKTIRVRKQDAAPSASFFEAAPPPG